MFDVAALGELLIDFTEAGTSVNGAVLFERNPGGAPANVLAAAARCGARTAFLGKIGSDMHGAFLKETLEALGTDVSGVVEEPGAFTTLAFVTVVGPDGERAFSFARKPGADTLLRKEELKTDVLCGTRILHVGSLSLTDEPARSATYEAVRIAKEAGAVVSYDPNYRAPLWPGRETAKARMREMLPYADLVKLSDEETELLTGRTDPEEAADVLHGSGVSCAIVTLGERGALVSVRGEKAFVPGFSVGAVDTTGAGDAFCGAFLAMLAERSLGPECLTLREAAECARFANAAAALCVTKRGAIPAMPERKEIEALLADER